MYYIYIYVLYVNYCLEKSLVGPKLKRTFVGSYFGDNGHHRGLESNRANSK